MGDDMTVVTILGCGPSGLVAAQAAQDAGFEVVIFSKKRPSHLWGCQYLHAPIPGITPLEPVKVEYRLDGKPNDYRLKVYGAEWRGDVSPEEFEGNHEAWDLRTTYARLWDRWESRVVDVVFTNGNMAADVMPDLLRTGPVFSTLPRPILCNNRDH